MRFQLKWRSYSMLALVGSFALAGCTAVRVQPVTAEHKINHICINDNPRVLVGDFVSVMQEGFQKHGITSQVVSGMAPTSCSYTSNYTATRRWDMAMYMTDAQIDILLDGRQIASVNYHLKGGGGLSLNKWDGTRNKILPVIDQLLAQLSPASERILVPVAAQVPVSPQPDSGSQGNQTMTTELARKLAQLRDAFDAGLITREEYETKRKELIDNF